MGGRGAGVHSPKKLEFSLSASLRKGSEYLGAREDEEEKEVESWPECDNSKITNAEKKWKNVTGLP